MIAPTWEGHHWVFDLISEEELRRRRAQRRARKQIEELRRTNGEMNDVWSRAGWSPSDPLLVAEMKRARTAFADAMAATLYAPINGYTDYRRYRLSDARERGEPFAVLFLDWERAFPDEWAQEAVRWGSHHGLKESILQAMHRNGVGEPARGAVERLVLAAVAGHYRAKDWRYARVARQVDSTSLRDALSSMAGQDDGEPRMRAQFVLSRLEDPELSINRRSYGNWLTKRGRP